MEQPISQHKWPESVPNAVTSVMEDPCLITCAFATRSQMSAEEVAWVNDWGREGVKVFVKEGGGGRQKWQEGWCWQCNVQLTLTKGVTSSPAFVTLSQNQVATCSSPQCGSSSS